MDKIYAAMLAFYLMIGTGFVMGVESAAHQTMDWKTRIIMGGAWPTWTAMWISKSMVGNRRHPFVETRDHYDEDI